MDKKNIFKSINSIDSLNEKIDNILDTQYVEVSGQNIKATDTFNGYTGEVLLEGNTHNNIAESDPILVQPTADATKDYHYLTLSYNGKSVDEYSIHGKTIRNYASSPKSMVVQGGQVVSGVAVALTDTVAGGEIDDLTIHGVSEHNLISTPISSFTIDPLTTLNVEGSTIPLNTYIGEANIDTNMSINREYSIVFDASLKTGIAGDIVIEVDGIEYTSHHKLLDDERVRHVIKVISAKNHSVVKFKTVSVIIENLMILEGFKQEFYLYDYFIGVRSVETTIKLATCGVNILDYTKNAPLQNATLDKDGYLSFDLSGTDQSVYGICSPNNICTYIRDQVRNKYTAVFDVKENNAVKSDPALDMAKFGKVTNTKNRRSKIMHNIPTNFNGTGYSKIVYEMDEPGYLKHSSKSAEIEFFPTTNGNINLRYMVVEGDVSTKNIPYQPFTELTKEIKLTSPLRSLPDGTCDTIERIGNKYFLVRRVGQKTFNGSGSESWGHSWTFENTYRVRTRSSQMIDYESKTNGKVNFIIQSYLNDYPENVMGDVGAYLLNGELDVVINKNGVAEADCVTKFREYLENNPIAVLYELKTWTFEEIEIPVFETRDTHTHIYSYNKMPPRLSVSSFATVKTANLKPSTDYTLSFDADINTSNINTLDLTFAGIDKAITVEDGPNYIQRVYRTGASTETNNIVFKTKGMKIENVTLIEGDSIMTSRHEQHVTLSSSGELDDVIQLSNIGANIFKAVPYNRGNCEFNIINTNTIQVHNTVAGSFKMQYFVLQNAIPNTSYDIRAFVRIHSGSARLYVAECGISDGTPYDAIINIENVEGNISNSFTTSNRIGKDRVVCLALYSALNPAQVGNVHYENISICRSEDTTYQFNPYSEKLINIPLVGGPLRSLPNGVRDTIEKKSDGKWYIVRRIGKYVIDHTNSSMIANANTKNTMNTIILKTSSSPFKPGMAPDLFISSKLINIDDTYMVSHDREIISINKNSEFHIRLSRSRLKNNNEQAALNWLKLNPIEVFSEMVVHEETIITNPGTLDLLNRGTHISSYDDIKPLIQIKNACEKEFPLLLSNKTYTIIVRVNSAFGKKNSALIIRNGGAFISINPIYTDSVNRFILYHGVITTTVDKLIRFDGPGMNIGHIQIIEGDISKEFFTNNLPKGIHSVGDNGSIMLQSTGKNILDISKYTTKDNVTVDVNKLGEMTITNTTDDVWRGVAFIVNDLDPSKEYTLSTKYEILSGLEKISMMVRYSNEYGDITYAQVIGTGKSGNLKLTFIPKYPIHQIEFLTSENTSNINGVIRLSELQLEVGTDKTSFEMFESHSVLVPLTQGGLRKLPGGVSDTLEYINEVPTIVRRVGYVKFNGAEDWENVEFPNSFKFTISWNEFKKYGRLPNISPPSVKKEVSNNYNRVRNSIWTVDEPAIAMNPSGNLSFQVGVNNIILANNTVGEFREWIKADPIEVYYELEEYVYEPLHHLDLSLQTYNGITNITTINTNVKPNITTKFSANLGAIIKTNSDRIDIMMSKLERLEDISFTNILNIIDLQEQLDNHIKKL